MYSPNYWTIEIVTELIDVCGLAPGINAVELQDLLIAWSRANWDLPVDEDPWTLSEYAAARDYEEIGEFELSEIERTIATSGPFGDGSHDDLDDPESEEREQVRVIQRARVQALVGAGFTLDRMLATATKLYVDEGVPIEDLGQTTVELAEAVLRGFN